MKKNRDSDEGALADRLVNYSDALVAVAFLGSSGLGVAVADPDIRCSIAQAIPQIITSNFVNAIILSGLVLLLRRWEADLRSDAKPAPKIAKYTRWLHSARLIIIWIAFLMSTLLVMASRSERCEEGEASAYDSPRSSVHFTSSAYFASSERF